MELFALFLPRSCTEFLLMLKGALRIPSLFFPLFIMASLANKHQHEERLEPTHFAMASIMTWNYSIRAVRIFQATFAIVILGLCLYRLWPHSLLVDLTDCYASQCSAFYNSPKSIFSSSSARYGRPFSQFLTWPCPRCLPMRLNVAILFQRWRALSLYFGLQLL